MNEYEWRQSGKDACSHAFGAEGGYIQRHNLVSVVPLSTDVAAIEEYFGPYEAFIAECGHIVPIAMLMSHSAGPPCTACHVLTSTALLRRPYSHNPPPATAVSRAAPWASTDVVT